MLIDHIAWLFVPPYTVLWECMHFVGRLTGPTMAVFIAEGYRYTKDAGRYTARLAIFAFISWPCFSLMEYGRITLSFGVLVPFNSHCLPCCSTNLSMFHSFAMW